MSVHYHLREWALEHVGSARPADVKRYFDVRGCVLSDETWRKFLHGPPPSFPRDTWNEICCAAGERLSTFMEIIPDQTRQPVVVPPARRSESPAPATTRFPAPPNPWTSFGTEEQE